MSLRPKKPEGFPDDLDRRALEYHLGGKISVCPSKPCASALDISLAYTPGVAAPVLEIYNNPESAYSYTSKGNLVAVVSNGSAVLGLGDRGALASKPVMEGKGLLFKRFADIDVFDIELNTSDPEKIIQTVKLMEPTFGGINLEDIKAPECFEIEERLISECGIPVFHDDQHGTAVVCTAALMNAAVISGKSLPDLKVVFNGAGAAGISCAAMFIEAGVARENITMCDIGGVIYKGRPDISERQAAFAADTVKRTLAEVMAGADVFVGVSAADCVTQDMVRSMAARPIVFALANPKPEISYIEAVSSRDDVIAATGRSDSLNQINNLLCFPFMFRGALDVRAAKISGGMKMAAAKAIALLAREPVASDVINIYSRDFSFGSEYIVPKPFDPRVIEYVASAVAKAACDEGIAAKPIDDWNSYRLSLRERMAKYWNNAD
ncbi:MAG: malate dehydrogenase [Leptospirales bacterium]|nr:malate dehydrogenase [Leptospirales bacterium]